MPRISPVGAPQKSRDFSCMPKIWAPFLPEAEDFTSLTPSRGPCWSFEIFRYIPNSCIRQLDIAFLLSRNEIPTLVHRDNGIILANSTPRILSILSPISNLQADLHSTSSFTHPTEIIRNTSLPTTHSSRVRSTQFSSQNNPRRHRFPPMARRILGNPVLAPGRLHTRLHHRAGTVREYAAGV